MMNRSLKLAAGIILAIVMLLGAFWCSGDPTYTQEAQQGLHSMHSSKGSQALDSSSRYSLGIPDGVLSSESGSVSLIRTGRQGEETVESVLFL